MKNKNLNDLRESLFDTIDMLKNGDEKMDVNKAKAISGIAGNLIKSAKLEVDLIKAVGRSGDSVPFVSDVKQID